MTIGEDMKQLAARLARMKQSNSIADQADLNRQITEVHTFIKELEDVRRQQLGRIRDAYNRLDDAIFEAFELTDDERQSLREWGNVNFTLLNEVDNDDD
jgi:hypothetical protein